MKLNKVMGIMTVIATLFSCSIVLAADETETVKVGTPIDLSTGAEATNIKSDSVKYLAFPVEINTVTNQFISFEFKFDFNNEILQYGIADIDSIIENDVNFDNNTYELGGIGFDIEDDKKGVVITPIVGNRNRIYGTYSSVQNTESSASYSWFDTSTRDLITDGPDLYLLYTVIGDVDYEKLNQDLVTINKDFDFGIGIKSDTNSKDVSAEGNTINACEGAFKLTVNPENLAPGVYINSLKAKVNSGTEVEIVNGTENEDGTYTFPVRLTRHNGGTASVVISGTYGNSESDVDGAAEFTLEAFNVTLDSPTEYAAPEGATVTVTK